MPRKKAPPSPERLAKIVRRYNAGDCASKISRAMGFPLQLVYDTLAANGVAPRSRGKAAIIADCPDTNLSAVTAARWQELYWGPERYSVARLAGLFGVSAQAVKTQLKRHGIAIRGRSEAKRIEFQLGRLKSPSYKGRPGVHPKGVLPPGFDATRLHNAPRSKPKRSPTVAERCGWCGEAIELPRTTRTRYPACDPSHRTALLRFLRHALPGTPRPLIVGRLAQLAHTRILALRDHDRDGRRRPNSWEGLAKLGAEIGARDEEVEAVVFLQMEEVAGV